MCAITILIKYLCHFIFRLQQQRAALKVSKSRLKTFYDQLNNHLKNKQQIIQLINDKEKRIMELEIHVSSVGVYKTNCSLFITCFTFNVCY